MSRISTSAEVPETLSGKRFDQAAASLFPDYSRSRLKRWILSGELTLDGDQCRPREPVEVGAILAIDAERTEETSVAAQAVQIDTVFVDPALIVINKPVGLVVHPGAGNPDTTLQNGLLHAFPELASVPRAGIIHRLDKDTSGLLIIARTLEAHTELVRRLAAREIDREYLAVCDGVLTGGGTVKAAIDRHPVQRTRMSVQPSGREAVTHYRVVQRYFAHTLIRVKLETGRTHQIRVHMAHIRHGLVGDRTYNPRLKLPAGADESLTEILRGFRRQALHATRLAFAHPLTDEVIEVEAPPPADFARLTRGLQAHADSR